MLSPQKKEEVRQMIEVVMMKNLPLDNSFEWREEVANLIVEKFDQLLDEELSSHTQEIREKVEKLSNKLYESGDITLDGQIKLSGLLQILESNSYKADRISKQKVLQIIEEMKNRKYEDLEYVQNPAHTVLSDLSDKIKEL